MVEKVPKNTKVPKDFLAREEWQYQSQRDRIKILEAWKKNLTRIVLTQRVVIDTLIEVINHQQPAEKEPNK